MKTFPQLGVFYSFTLFVSILNHIILFLAICILHMFFEHYVNLCVVQGQFYSLIFLLQLYFDEVQYAPLNLKLSGKIKFVHIIMAKGCVV